MLARLLSIGVVLLLAACASTSSEETTATPGIGQGYDSYSDVSEGELGRLGSGVGYIGSEQTPDRVFFGYDSSILTNEAQATLQRQADWLAQNPAAIIAVEGHCDERGTREYNLALGERRANAVKSYLISLGVDSSRISTISYGKERPAVVGSSSQAWAQNRRGVTVVN